MWSMMNLLEGSLRVPLAIRAAGGQGGRGGQAAGGQGQAVHAQAVYEHPVELLDLYAHRPSPRTAGHRTHSRRRAVRVPACH